MSERRDRLRGRGRPSAAYLLPVGNIAAAAREVRLAGQAWSVSQLRTDEGAAEAVAAARQALDQAEEALQACYEEVRLTALAPEDYEALIAKHEPREGTDDELWDTTTFPKACFLACAPGDMSAPEWEDFLTSNVSWVERDDLLNLAIAVNVRQVNPAIPKG